MIKKKKIWEYFLHIIGLLLLAILPMFIFDKAEEKIKFWTYRYYFHFIFLMIAFYVNYLIFIPRFFFSKKRIKFSLSLLLLSLALLSTSQYLSTQLDFLKPPKEKPNKISYSKPADTVNNKFWLHPQMLENALLLLLVFGFSTGMGVLQKWKKDEELQKELYKANVETELAFLKNQINPHFFFNSLNNIYALVAIDGERAQKAIEELSGLMRYLIYESNIELVPLKKEFEFSRNYIALMQQRLSAKVKMTVNIQENLPDREVPPLLFISLIENAFKHGISYRGNSFIEISLQMIGDNILFKCKNSIPEISDQKITKPGGMGISNIKKRLELLYGNQDLLKISALDNVFKVELEIPTEVKI